MTEEYGSTVIECAQNASYTSNITVDPWSYIKCFRGDQTQELAVAIPVTVVNAIIFVTGLLGNLAVCIVIIKHRTLHSPTNYYLLNLSLSDVTLLLFGLPYDISLYWYQYPWILGEFICQARALISEMASYVSVLTVVAFSTERYLAICHPLYKLAISSLQRALRIITCLWILSFLFAFPFAINSSVHYIAYPLNSSNMLPITVLKMQCSKIESGVQLFSRVSRKSFLENINPDLFPEGGPYPNQVIEVTGDPNIDKNDLLIDFIVKCILPNKYNKEWKGSSAVLINTEFQISILKIIKVIETLIMKYNVTDSRKVVIQNALKNLIIFNCYNLDELQVTFYYVEKIIQCNENINLVVIDNIAAHYWISSYNLCDTPSYYQHSLKMFEILYNVIKSLQVLLIFVRHERTTNKKKFNKKVDFKIEVQKVDQSYKAVVTNYDKQTVVEVAFQIKTILEFVSAINQSSS